MSNGFGARATLQTADGPVAYYRLDRLAELGLGDVSRLPYSVKVLLEGALRYASQDADTTDDVLALARWRPRLEARRDVAFRPARVLHQDFNGGAAMVDLLAMRSAVRRLGGNPEAINPVVPTDFVVDHSVQVDFFGTGSAFARNVALEFQRNEERYRFLRWAQHAFRNFRVVPPGTGIVHQVNLEFLATVVQRHAAAEGAEAYPDSVVGTDSHTTMVNGLGVLGWGVGGIEAEAVMLGRPLSLSLPEVVGVRLSGRLREGVTATDLVLTVTQALRRHGVVGRFVEFCGSGLAELSLADRATVANMAPEYGATCGFVPVDEETLRYLRGTGRAPALVDLVERYTKAQGLFRTAAAPEPAYSDLVELDLSTIETSLAGPFRPQDRVPLREMKQAFAAVREAAAGSRHPAAATKEMSPVVLAGGSVSVGAGLRSAPTIRAGEDRRPPANHDARRVGEEGQAEGEPPSALSPQSSALRDGAVAIAAITSCTNTSNPSVMIGAGLLARKAIEHGLTVKPYVKTSLAPGSPVVADYLERAGLMPALEALGFHVAGFGCTTCAGGSGPLIEPVAVAVREADLLVAAVLSGNRNFEGRIHPLCRLAYLASPPLVVAYALAGTVDIDLEREAIGEDQKGHPVYLQDIWPSEAEIQETLVRAMDPDLYRERYAMAFSGEAHWQALPILESPLYTPAPSSTYIQEPPFFQGIAPEPGPLEDIHGARVLVSLGDYVTTDHISPAGTIPVDSSAGRYLREHGVPSTEFNSYGARRGNHEVMVRGTFANIHLRNHLAPGREGSWTLHFPSDEVLSIYEAAIRYRVAGMPLIVLAGKEYGAGSSRDWAAKGTALLGVRAVLAESYERIHRSNLAGMGVLPLQFLPGESAAGRGLTGHEVFDIDGIAGGLTPLQHVTVRTRRGDGTEHHFEMIVRLDSVIEVEYYRHGGILPYVLRRLLPGQSSRLPAVVA